MLTPNSSSRGACVDLTARPGLGEPRPIRPDDDHIAALDGIRGIAILAVMAFHYGINARGFGFHHPLLTLTGLGWSGVDLFFVLSGFLITGILYESRGSEHYFRNFYIRRSLRIFPLYYLALAVVLVLSVIWPQAGVWGTHSGLWLAFYLTNFLMAVEGAPAVGILAHFWSLAVEEHFYLLWPLLVLSCSRQQLMGIAAAIAVGAVACRTAMLWSDLDPAVFLLTPLRMDALAVGAICALAIRGPRGIAAVRSAAWAAMIGAGVTVVVMIYLRRQIGPNDPLMQSFGYSLLAISFGGTILVALLWRPLNVIMSTPILCWFGRYSYGLYVWHPIVNVLLFKTSWRRMFADDDNTGAGWLLLFAFCLSVLISMASYHLWERRFLLLKRRFA